MERPLIGREVKDALHRLGNPLPGAEHQADEHAVTLTLLAEGEGTLRDVCQSAADQGAVFLRAAGEVLARRRPEIPLLVVEGRSGPAGRKRRASTWPRCPM